MSVPMVEIYNDGQKIGDLPTFYVEGRQILEMSESQYNAESTHTPGAIYIIWED